MPLFKVRLTLVSQVFTSQLKHQIGYVHSEQPLENIIKGWQLRTFIKALKTSQMRQTLLAFSIFVILIVLTTILVHIFQNKVVRKSAKIYNIAVKELVEHQKYSTALQVG